MNKDDSIKDLVQSLSLDSRGWVLIDHWDADLCAIGLARRGALRWLVYISSFGRTLGRYDYQCETPTGDEPDEYEVTASGEDVDREALLAVLESHLAPIPSDTAEE